MKTPFFVSMGRHLKDCPLVRTLGIRPDIHCYTEEELHLLKSAPVILFPTWRYLHVFQASGRSVFPSYSSYHLIRSPYLQYILAHHLKIPGLRARAYAGRKRKDIPGDFDYPFAVWPVRKRKPHPFIVKNKKDLETVCRIHHFVLVVELPDPAAARVDIITIGYNVVGLKGTQSFAGTEFLVKESLRLVTSAGIDYACVRWIKKPKGWKFWGLLPVPSYFTTMSGQSVSRSLFLCSFLRDIANGLAQPPWQITDRAT